MHPLPAHRAPPAFTGMAVRVTLDSTLAALSTTNVLLASKIETLSVRTPNDYRTLENGTAFAMRSITFLLTICDYAPPATTSVGRGQCFF